MFHKEPILYMDDLKVYEDSERQLSQTGGGTDRKRDQVVLRPANTKKKNPLFFLISHVVILNKSRARELLLEVFYD